MRYVGRSTSGLQRPKYHLLPCYYNSKKMFHYPVYRWIRKNLKKYNVLPTIVVIQCFENITNDDLNLCEKYWISYFNENLLNCTIGGDGVVGYRYSDQQKKHLSNIRKGKKMRYDLLQKNKQHLEGARKKIDINNVKIGTKLWWENLDHSVQNKIITNNLNYAGKNKIKVTDQFNNTYNSLAEAAQAISCAVSAISLAIKNNRPCKGFLFRKVV